MTTFVEELVHYLTKMRYPGADIPDARDRLQSELKKTSGSRVLNNLNTKDHHTHLHALNCDKYKELMSLFDQASATTISQNKKGNLEEGLFVLDAVSQSTLRSWMDAIVLEACERLLDDKGHIRQDVLNFLGLKDRENELNQTHHLLQSYVQHMTEEISVQWQKENVGKVESKRSVMEQMSNEQKIKNEQACFKGNVFTSMQYFFTKYFNNESYIQSKVDEYLFSLTCNIAAKCAGELKELSQKLPPATYQAALKNYILSDFEKITLLSRKDKLEFWIEVVSFSAGNGDYLSLEVFLQLFTEERRGMDELSDAKKKQHVSNKSLFAYYKKGWTKFDDSEGRVEKKEEEPVNADKSVHILGVWMNSRNNNELIDVILQKYHRNENFPEADKKTQHAEKRVLLELEKKKFGEDISMPTAEFLAQLADKVGKEGRLAAIVTNLVRLEKYENRKRVRNATFIYSSSQISQVTTLPKMRGS